MRPSRYQVLLCLPVPATLGETSATLLGRAYCETDRDRRKAMEILRSAALDPQSRASKLFESPTAFYTTHGWANLRDSLESYCARGRRIWRAPESHRWEVTRWKGESAPALQSGLRFHSSSTTEGAVGEGPCSLTVWRRFGSQGETLAFTIGHLEDSCSEAPRILWTARDGRKLRAAIPPLYGWNVEGLWRTEHYLVLGLNAAPDLRRWDERLAFWDLRSGEIVVSPAPWWDDSAGTVGRDGVISDRLPGWRQAVVAEVGDGIVLALHGKSITFWPGRHAYSVEAEQQH